MGKHGPCYHCGVTSEFLCLLTRIFSSKFLGLIQKWFIFTIELIFFKWFCNYWLVIQSWKWILCLLPLIVWIERRTTGQWALPSHMCCYESISCVFGGSFLLVSFLFQLGFGFPQSCSFHECLICNSSCFYIKLVSVGFPNLSSSSSVVDSYL